MRTAAVNWTVQALVLAVLACTTSLPNAAAQALEVMETGRLLIRTREGFVTAMNSDRAGLRFARPAGITNTAVYTVTDGKSLQDKIDEIKDNPAIEFVEPDLRFRVNATAFSTWSPDDSLLEGQWHHTVIQSEEAWSVTRGNPEIKVCHVDSGIRTDHPDLAGRVLMGWNLVPEVQDLEQDPPSPGDPQYSNINDTYGHGTHTAGIIAAIGNNGLGGAGVAADVKLLVCRFIWDDGFGSIADALECLRLCRQQGATISSNSWGGVPNSKAIEVALHELETAGMLFVVASGNQKVDLDDRPAFPASLGLDNMIVVGSSGRSDELSPFSNYGKDTVHLLAPGEQILSTTINDWYGTMDGTSMACPIVAGAAALLQSAALSQGVRLSCIQTKQLLLGTADPSPDGEAADATITGGRLNIGAAMQALVLLLQERGLPALPGVTLESADAEELTRRLQENEWGQELLESNEAFMTAEQQQEVANVPDGQQQQPAEAPTEQTEEEAASTEQAGIIEADSFTVQAAEQTAKAAAAPAKGSSSRRRQRLHPRLKTARPSQ